MTDEAMPFYGLSRGGGEDYNMIIKIYETCP